MDTHLKGGRLSVGELEQLGRFLSQVTNSGALSLEGMDGLFCALIAGPSWVRPSEYLPLLWGGPLRDRIVAFNVGHVNAMIRLLSRHWNSIRDEFEGGAVHHPLITSRHAHPVPGRAWAQGFMRGANYVRVGWNELLQDDASSGLYRIPQLAQESNPPMRQGLPPMGTSSEILPWLGPAIIDAYRHFLDRRLADRLIVDLMDEVTSRWDNSPDRPS